MPFSVFRRHQRKLLVVFAIMAMIGFVLADSLPALLRAGGPEREDALVAELDGREVYRSDLAQIASERGLANAFMSNLMQRLIGYNQAEFFGSTGTSDLVDALILGREADRLGLPNGPELARQWLTQITGGTMNAAMFEQLRAPFGGASRGISGEQLLSALAGQVRLMQVRSLPGQPLVTPLDVYQAFRDRYEMVSARAVKFPVSDFLNKVGEPSDAQVRAFFDRSKDVFPDPSRPTPGFKLPRRVQVEYLTLDGAALEREIVAKLTDEELRRAYESRKSEYALPGPQELPEALFADDPENERTPPPTDPSARTSNLQPNPDLRTRPFAEVRPILAAGIAEDRAREEIDRRFEDVRGTMLDFADEYSAVRDQNEETGADDPLPAKPDLKSFASKADLVLESTPLLDEAEAAKHGRISSARVGLGGSTEGRSFVDEFFSPGETLFEPIEMSDMLGRVYLAWKVEDRPARVPSLDEKGIRSEVVRAWKREQARPLARKAAEELAAKAKAAGGSLNAEVIGDRTILTTDPIARLESAGLPIPNQFNSTQARPTEIPQIPNAGEAVRDALFGLETGQVAVAPDQPEDAFYTLALERRNPVGYTTLYAPTGPRMGLQTEVQDEARMKRLDAWMAHLRAQAGLPADWSPPEEAETGRGRRRG